MALLVLIVLLLALKVNGALFDLFGDDDDAVILTPATGTYKSGYTGSNPIGGKIPFGPGQVPWGGTGRINSHILPVPIPVPFSRGQSIAVAADDPVSDTSFGGLFAMLIPLLIILSLFGIRTPAVGGKAPDLIRQARCPPCPQISANPACPAVTVCQPEVQCPDGFNTVTIQNVQSPVSCYAYKTGIVTPVQAMNECRKLGGNLWTFETSEEFNAVTTDSGLAVGTSYIVGNSNAFNNAADLELSNICNGAPPPIPVPIVHVTAISGQCNFMTVSRDAANNRNLGRVTCAGIANIGYVCEADISKVTATCG